MASNMTPQTPAVPTKTVLSIQKGALTGDVFFDTFSENFFFNGRSPVANIATNFLKFPKLSAELRLKIFAHAYADVEGRDLSIEPQRACVPSLLQVCYDARQMGLKIYERQEYEAKDGRPSYVTIINHKRDAFNLAVGGDADNAHPQPGDPTSYHYTHPSPGPVLHIIIPYRNNRILWAIDNYPQRCKTITRINVHSLHLHWFAKLARVNNAVYNMITIEGFFKTHFPALETIGVVPSELRDVDGDLTQQEQLVADQLKDSDLYTFLAGVSKEGRIVWRKDQVS